MSAVTASRLHQLFQEWLGASVESEQGVIRLVEAGLPLRVLPRLIRRGLSKDEIFHVIINSRTLKHRKNRNEPLSRAESERAVRTARILARAEVVLGDSQAALQWLRAPKRRFEGRTPMDLLATEAGGRLVEQMLIQIDEGMFA